MPPKSKSVPFKVFSGLEEFDLDRQLAKEKSIKNRHVILLDGNVDSDEIVSACTAHSYLDDGKNRYVIVDHAEKVKHPESLLSYIEGKDTEDVSVTLVAFLRPIYRLDKPPEIKIPEVWAKAAVKGSSKVFNTLPPWETQAKVDRINAEAINLGVRLGKNVAEGIIKLVGYDLYIIYNELKKISLLVGSGTVTLDHVRKVVASQPPAAVLDLANAAFEKDTKRAMSLLSHLWIYEGDGALVPVVGALIRNVERLLMVRSMVDAGKTQDEIVSQLGLKKKFLQSTFLLWANRHTVQSLTNHLAAFCQLDANVKGPSRSKRTQVELAVLSVAS